MTSPPNRPGRRRRSRFLPAGSRRRQVRDHQIAVEAMTRFGRNDVPALAQREPLALLCASLSDEAQLTSAGARAARERLIELVGAWPVDATPSSDPAPAPATVGPLIVTGLPGAPTGEVTAELLDEGAAAVGPPDPLEVMLCSWTFEIDWHIPGYAEWLHDAHLGEAYGRTARWLASMPGPARTHPLLSGPGHLERLAEIGAAMGSATVLVIESEVGSAVERTTELVCTRRQRFSDHVDPAAVERYLAFRLGVMAERSAVEPSGLRVIRVPEAVAREDPRRVAATVMDGGRDV